VILSGGIGSFLPTFREHLSVPFPRIEGASPLKMGPNFHYCIQKKPATCSYPKPNQYIHSFPTNFKISFNIIIQYTTSSFQMFSFSHVSPRKTCMISLLPLLATYPAYHILLHLITWIILVMSTDHKVPR
jgi:hypothetical protein